MPHARLVIPAIVSALVAAGCGGGGSDQASGPPAEGVYGGALTAGSTSSSFQMLVLENDEFWVIYGAQTSTSFLISGFIQGAGTSSNGAFSSSSLRDYGVSPPLAGTATGSYNADAKTISGTVSFSGRSVGFSGGPVPGSLYSYSSAASLGAVAGSWSVGVNTGETANLAISAGGALTLVSSGGCTGTGSVVPRPSGKNVFNVAVTFGGAPCALPGGTVSGIAVSYPIANGRTQLIAAGRNSAQTAGFLVAGTR